MARQACGLVEDIPRAIDAARARLLSHRTHRATGDVEGNESLLPRRFDDDAGRRERAATIRLARMNRTRQHANWLAGRGLAAGACGASTHRLVRNGARLAQKRASPVGSNRAGHCHGSGRRRPAGLGHGHRGAPSGLAGLSDGPSGARGSTSRAAQIAEPLARAWVVGFDQSRTRFAAVDGFPATIAVRRALEQTAAPPVTGGSRGVRHGYRTGASRGDRRCGAASAPAPEKRRTSQDTPVLGASQQGRHSNSNSSLAAE